MGWLGKGGGMGNSVAIDVSLVHLELIDYGDVAGKSWHDGVED